MVFNKPNILLFPDRLSSFSSVVSVVNQFLIKNEALGRVNLMNLDVTIVTIEDMYYNILLFVRTISTC